MVANKFIIGEKYYPATHSSYLIKNTTTILKYYCVNHKLNTPYKRMLFNNNKCNGKIEYNRKTGEFFLINKQNNICDKKIKKYMIIWQI